MAGNCWICNPICSRCKPPIYKAVTCKECNGVTIFEKPKVVGDQPLLCSICGHDLTAIARPKVVKCRYKGVLCAYPCDKAYGKLVDDTGSSCKLNTPPSEEWLSSHPTAAKLNGFA